MINNFPLTVLALVVIFWPHHTLGMSLHTLVKGNVWVISPQNFLSMDDFLLRVILF